MAIVRNILRAPRLDGDFSPGSVDGISSEDEDGEFETQSSASESDGLDLSEDDSGMGSDGCDLSDLGEAGTEFCQVGNQSFSIPLELYDVHDLGSILSVETWNQCLSEEERFSLAEYLPDMDQETFTLTLVELFSGGNFHFGSPLLDIFNRLKSGQCEPKVNLYRRGLNFFQRREHYHHLRKYQNSMVGGLFRIRDAWENCRGYGIEERLRLLNIIRSQSPLGCEKDGDAGSVTDSEDENSNEVFWNERAKLGRRALGLVGRDNPRGILKVAALEFSSKDYSEAVGCYPLSVKRDVEKKWDGRSRNQMRGDDGYLEEQSYELGVRGEWNANLWKPRKGKKQQFLKNKDTHIGIGDEDYDGLQHAAGRIRNSNQVTVASYGHHPRETGKKAKYLEKDWMYSTKDKVLSGAQADLSDGNLPIWHPDKFHGRSIGVNKWKGEEDSKSFLSKKGADLTARTRKSSPSQFGGSHVLSNHRLKTSKEKSRSKFGGSRGMNMEYSIRNIKFDSNEETESDSSEQDEEDGEINPLMRQPNLVYPSGARMGHRSGIVRSEYDPMKANKLVQKDKRDHALVHDGSTNIHAPEVEPYTRKGRHKGKRNEPAHLYDMKWSQPSHQLQQPSLKASSGEKRRKMTVDLDSYLMTSNYTHDYGKGHTEEVENDLYGTSESEDDQMRAKRSGNRTQSTDARNVKSDYRKAPNLPLSGCNTMAKKQKEKVNVMPTDEWNESVYQQSSPKRQIDDPILTKKRGKQKTDVGAGSLTVATAEPASSEKGRDDDELETRPQKKPFTLITPTIHTGFSFSIIHLLSAVRKAMINSQMEDVAEFGDHIEGDDGRQKLKREESDKTLQVVSKTQPSHSLENTDVNTIKQAGQLSLTVQEIVNRVRSNPGDPCILETQEPLQDLVRGVLKIFSSKTAPLGAKGWKALVIYEKSNKSWSWVGPVTSGSSDNETLEEETSSEAWGLPHKMLVSLVNAFANWLKSGQETLQQIGSLPPPPAMMPTLDEKERFRDLRAQKSLNTISPSTDEVRAYFRREEVLRYSIPDRAFSYTAADGKKSIVAPLRRGAGKPTSKARDHFMLKPDRPPHVTILCLVRDAAARLPGSIGTRADVCTLIRDSQYIVENISDSQVNQVVSGALDRLHYERDPCVQFDGDRKLWVYLHRDRDEEDFEDDGTASTKKWKRPRKDASEHSDTGAVNDVSGDAAVDASCAGYDLNVDSSSIHAVEKTDVGFNDLRPVLDNIGPFTGSALGNRSRGNPANREVLGSNPLPESQMLCQENSTNEDFDDDVFSRERPVGLLTASLLS